MRIVFTLACLFIIFSCSAQSFLKIADSIRRIRGIPAIGYVVFTSDSILESAVTGSRKYRTRDTARLTDRFHIGTNTFAFTSWVAGKLVESGKIKWTTTYISLFPQFRNKILPEFQNVDLKDLLSNRAGLKPYRDINDFAFVPLFDADPRVQRREFAGWLLQRPGLNPNREKKMVESVASYAIAVAMLEKVSGMSWEKLVDVYVNKPLGIAVKFGWPNTISTAQPYGHWSKYGSLTPEAPDTWVKQYPATLSASGINLTVGDYARFLQNELKGLRGGKSYLTKKTLDLIHFGLVDYAFGWENGVIADNRVALHTGESYLFNSHVELLPEKNIGILVVCNNGDPMGKGAVVNLCRMLRDYYLNR